MNQAPTQPLLHRPQTLSWIYMASALVCLAGALVVAPSGHEHTAVLGVEIPGVCTFLQLTGLPCPGCGMTRSWVWLVRGEVATALQYNVAGSSLFLWIQAMGLLGAARLLLKKPGLLRMSSRAFVIGSFLWAGVLMFGFWGLRLAGWYPMPAPF